MKLIIDLDTGMDDAQALMLALRSPEAEVLAVTCVGGNVPLDTVVRNTRLVVAAATPEGRPRPRIFAGCQSPLVANCGRGIIRAIGYHGNDGIGGSWDRLDTKQASTAVDSVQVESQHASVGLIEVVSQHKGEVTLLALAPLTNIAVALRLEPQLGTWLKGVIVMGGANHSLGNTATHLCAEFNFAHDPEAARLVLHELLPCPRLLVPYEVCLSGSLPYEWARNWVNYSSEAIKKSLWRQLNQSLVVHQCKIQQNSPAADTTVGPIGFRSCDLLAACICLRPALVTQAFTKYCSVELAGSNTRGQLVVDWFHKIDRGFSQADAEKATFVTEVDKNAYGSMLSEILG